MLTMKKVCVIPARLASTRFPRKVLAELGGKPLLQRTWEAATKVPHFDEVWVAVDSKELLEFVKTFTDRVLLTSDDCHAGIDRLIEVRNSKKVIADLWINWQADEPFITEKMIDDLLSTTDGDVFTLKKKMASNEPIDDPNIVKVVTDKTGRALYFSRFSIPYMRTTEVSIYKHLGIYAYTDEALERISHMPPAEIEKAELLEQLRYLYNGLSIHVTETEGQIIGIDHPDDLLAAQKMI